MGGDTAATAGLAGTMEVSHRPALSRIVVGFDERPASRDALALATRLCEGSDCELIVASIRPYWPQLLGAEAYLHAVTEDEAWLRREARKGLGGRRFSTRVVSGGHEATGLKEIAAAEEADLIVVGSTHRGAVGRAMPGSFGERLLNNCPCAVGIAPLGLAVRGLRVGRVAVAYDGSRAAAVALRLAYEIAERAGGSLLVLGAVPIEIDETGQRVSPEQLDEARMERHLARAESGAPPTVAVESRLLHGTPSRVLPEAAEEADLLVLGSRGSYGSARRLFMGSVARHVARQAPCATLITPAP